MVSVCLPSDALLQHLPSYLGFSYLRRGVSLHGCSSKVHPLLLTLDEGYLTYLSFPISQSWGREKNAKVGSQETPGITSKFGLEVRNEAGQRLIEFCQENALVIANILFQKWKRRLYTWTSPHGQHQIRLIIFFTAKDGEAPYSQQKQDRELTVDQIMNSLLQNSDLIDESRENH